MAPESEQPAQQEAYMHAYDGALTEQVIAGRTAEIHGAFFLPHLRAGMDLLDCGCGPGSITCGLAKAVAPGHVTGIDLEESQLELARANAAQAGLTNVTFERGSAYELPFQEGRFDAVFSHAMLSHMADPLTVIKEMHRVLKPGGLIGLRDVDLAATLIAPDEDATLTRAHDIWVKYRRHCGGDPSLGQRLRALLRAAGFANTIGTASAEAWGVAERVASFLPALSHEFTGPEITATALEKDWADQAEMDKAARALADWGDNPDAFMAITWCEAVGRKE